MQNPPVTNATSTVQLPAQFTGSEDIFLNRASIDVVLAAYGADEITILTSVGSSTVLKPDRKVFSEALAGVVRAIWPNDAEHAQVLAIKRLTGRYFAPSSVMSIDPRGGMVSLSLRGSSFVVRDPRVRYRQVVAAVYGEAAAAKLDSQPVQQAEAVTPAPPRQLIPARMPINSTDQYEAALKRVEAQAEKIRAQRQEALDRVRRQKVTVSDGRGTMLQIMDVLDESYELVWALCGDPFFQDEQNKEHMAAFTERFRAVRNGAVQGLNDSLEVCVTRMAPLCRNLQSGLAELTAAGEHAVANRKRLVVSLSRLPDFDAVLKAAA